MAGSGELFKRSDDTWGFRVKAADGQTVAVDSGSGYPDKSESKATLEKLLGGEYDGPVTEAPTTVCGAEITADTTLDTDLVCERGPALVVAADNVTLDLGGHSVSGRPDAGGGPGILLQGVSGVTVKNGTVQHFDAGVVVDGGSGNHVMHLTVRDNIGSPDGDYGDGIVVRNSSDNHVHDNTVARNGPFSGIALGPDCQGNHIRNNMVTDNNMMHAGDPGAGRQDMGIRIEGPAANNNSVVGNTVTGSGANGIAILATCANDANCAGTPANEQNEVASNTCNRNGTSGQGAGVKIFSLPNPITPVKNTVTNNVAEDNATFGISIDAVGNNNVGTTANTFRANRARNNPQFDGHDGNTSPPCGTNLWEDNDFGTVNQPCVRGAQATQRVAGS